MSPAIDTSRDAANCGEPNHVCSPIPVAVGQASPRAIVMDEANIYWLNEGTRTYEGCGALPSRPGSCWPVLTPNADGSVMTMPREGGTPFALASGQARPHAIAVDGANVYWSNLGSGTDGQIMKVSIAGGAPTQLASGGYGLNAIAVDSTSVYWTTFDAILSVPIGGGTPKTLVSDLDDPGALAVDARNLYWGMSGPNAGILKMPLDGGPPTPLLWLPCETWPTAMVADSQNLYWTQDYPGFLRSVSLDGGTPKTLGTSFNGRKIELTATALYWVDWRPGTATQLTPAVMRKPRGCGPATAIPTFGTAPSDIAIDERNIYWTSPAPDGDVPNTTPPGTIFGNGGSIVRLGSCVNGLCE